MTKTSVAFITLAVVVARMEAAAQQVSRGDAYGVTIVAEDECIHGVPTHDEVDVLCTMAAKHGLVAHKPEMEWYVTLATGGAQW